MQSDERIERLISRRIDGELTQKEALELERLLARSTEYQELLEETSLIDGVCGSVLSDALCDAAVSLHDLTLPQRGAVRKQRSSAWWWSVPVGLAACAALLVLALPTLRESSDGNMRIVEAQPPAAQISAGRNAPPEKIAGPNYDPWVNGIKQASDASLISDSRRDKQYYGVMGKDGNIYLIEVDRRRTYRIPMDRSGLRLAGGEL